MNKRIKELRKYMGLSQEEFGNRLGISKSAISKIEKGDFEPAQRTIKAICREFNVSYAWLVDGKGEMFSNIPETILDELIDEYDLDFLDKKIIKKYLELTSDERNAIKKYLKSLIEE